MRVARHSVKCHRRRIAAALIVAGTVSVAPFWIGFYEALEDAEIVRVYFIKKHPTLQMQFVNIFANDADDKPLDRLNEQQRQYVIDYCRYRLGTNTTLQTQAELDQCKSR